MRLGKIYQTKLNDLDQVIDGYNKIVEAEPGHYKVFYQLGLVYIDKKRFEKSLRKIKRSFKSKPQILSSLEIKPNYNDAINLYQEVI